MASSIFSIVTEASPRLLSTVERIKLELGVTSSEHDAYFAAKLAEVSDAVATYCNRAFGRTTVMETFRPAVNRPALILRGYPLVSLSTVMDGDVELDEYDWEIDSRNGIIHRLDGYGNPSSWGSDEVAVSYTYGWILPDSGDRDLPYDVEAAVLIQMKSEWFARRRDPMVKEVSIPDIISRSYWVSSGAQVSASINPDAAAKLSKYVVRRLG